MPLLKNSSPGGRNKRAELSRSAENKTRWDLWIMKFIVHPKDVGKSMKVLVSPGTTTTTTTTISSASLLELSHVFTFELLVLSSLWVALRIHVPRLDPNTTQSDDTWDDRDPKLVIRLGLWTKSDKICPNRPVEMKHLWVQTVPILEHPQCAWIKPREDTS